MHFLPLLLILIVFLIVILLFLLLFPDAAVDQATAFGGIRIA
jgi:hypothetical protein